MMLISTEKLVLAFAFVLVIGALTRCKSDIASNVENKENSQFEYIDDASSGVSFENKLSDSDSLNIVEYLYYYNGGGVAVGDINNDGLEDLFFCGNQVPSRLYANNGNMTFEDISVKAGISPNNTWSSGVAMDDVNGDGWIDIYVCKVAPVDASGQTHNELYINQKDGTFVEQSKEYGLDFRGFSTHAAFFDYDNDGDLDMYLLNHTVHTVRSYGNIDKRKIFDVMSGDRLFENKINEGKAFEDVSKAANIYSSPLGYGLAVACADVNNDGFTDIYVGNDFHENDYLYINNGDKTFTESNASLLNYTSQFSMGVDMADMNGDGWLDIFTTDMLPYDKQVTMKSAGEDADQIKRIKKDLGFEPQHARNHFHINNHGKSFSDIAYTTKTFATDWSWSVLLADFDNSGDRDIFVTNGIVKRPNDLDYINYLNANTSQDNNQPIVAAQKLIDKMPSQPLPNCLFLAQGPLTYGDLEHSFTGPASFSTGAAYADLDNDGDLDIVTNNINQKAFIIKNKANNTNYVSFILKNGSGLMYQNKGAKIMVYTGDEVISGEYQTTRGFMSSSTHAIHLGLGDQTKVDSAVILWPDGTKQLLESPKVGISHTVIKDNLGLTQSPNNNDSENIFVLPFKHNDNNYIDENSEKLTPERLSREGPCILAYDFNEDGIGDFYLGGGRNQAAQLYFGNKDGSYSIQRNADFDNDAKYEDVSAALIDFDADGDKDLYVVSGGNDNKELDKLLEDRIYLNNGKGVFRRIPLSLPHTNGSVIAVGDLDGDEYEDIFVGARSIPGMYGLSPFSFILKNVSGQGLEIAYKERFGMVTDAVWTDVNADGFEDLVFTGDWMPIRILQNDGKGVFTEMTKQLGLDDIKGFWNALEVADLDGDGHVEIIAGNTGTNTKWTATKEHPIDLYLGDFDKNGASDPIIFYHFFNQRMPFGSLDRLASQIPLLKKKFNTYESYSQVSAIEDLFADYKENLVEQKSVNTLEHMVFVLKDGKYEAQALPTECQRGEVRDILIDGRDIILVGNNNEFVAELGASLSSTGYIVKGLLQNGKTEVLPMGLPPRSNTRAIQKLKEDTFIISNNDGYCYIYVIK